MMDTRHVELVNDGLEKDAMKCLGEEIY